jgi:hypothetical protein
MKKITTPSRFASHPFNELKGSLTLLLFCFLLFCFLPSANLQAQVTIGKDEAPKPYSVLELHAQYETGVYGGLRLPHLTTTQRDALAVTAAAECVGFTIFNTTTKCVETWNGTKWISLCDDSGSGSGAGSYDGPGFPPVADKYKDITVANHGSPKTLRFMTYNLGADPILTPKQQMQVNGSPENIRVFGGWYQWGRKDHKHTFRGQPTPNVAEDDRFTTTLISNIGYPYAKVLSDHGKFVSALNYNWTTPVEDNCDLWGNGQPINTTGNSEPRRGWNDPCPAGWRVPTQHEWALLGSEGGNMFNAGGDNFNTSGVNATLPNSNLYWVKVVDGRASLVFTANKMCGYAIYERLVWEGAATGYKNGSLDLFAAAAPEPLLFLPAAGYRYYDDCIVGGMLHPCGFYWSSSVVGSNAHGFYLYENSVDASAAWLLRGYGYSVRCIAE